MFILSNLLVSLAQVLDLILNVLSWMIIIRALLTWVSPDPRNPIVQMLDAVTEPILWPIRRLLPFSLKFGFDISPIIAIMILVFLRSFLVKTLIDVSLRLR